MRHIYALTLAVALLVPGLASAQAEYRTGAGAAPPIYSTPPSCPTVGIGARYRDSDESNAVYVCRAGGWVAEAGEGGGGGGSPGGSSGDVQTNDGVGGFAGGQSLSSLATEAEVPGLVPTATTTSVGTVELATDGESAANVVVQGNDARMSNSRNASAITDGLIVDADVNASAAIAGSKLQAAGASNAGVVSTGAQTFAGEKAFPGGLVMPFNESFGSDPTLGSNGACAWDVDTPTGKSFGSNLVCHALGGAVKYHAPMMVASTVPASGSWIWGVNGTNSVPLTAPLANTWLDAELQALAGVTAAANTVPYFTSGSAAGVMDVSQTATNNSIVQRDASGGIAATAVTVSGGASSGLTLDNVASLPDPASGQGSLGFSTDPVPSGPSYEVYGGATMPVRPWIADTFRFFEDFGTVLTDSDVAGVLWADSNWAYSCVNAAAMSDGTSTPAATGHLRISLNTTASAACTLSRFGSSGSAVRLNLVNGMRFATRIQPASARCDTVADDDCHVVVGLCDDTDPASGYDCAYGAWFEYDPNVSTTKWLVGTAAGDGTPTRTTSTVDFTVGTYATLEFVADRTDGNQGTANATRVYFYINGSLVGSAHTTDIPDAGSTQDAGLMVGIARLGGSAPTDKRLLVDYIGVEHEVRR